MDYLPSRGGGGGWGEVGGVGEGEVEIILPVASWYRNQDKLRPDEAHMQTLPFSYLIFYFDVLLEFLASTVCHLPCSALYPVVLMAGDH